MNLEQYISEIKDKKSLDKFATEYFGLSLDGRSSAKTLRKEILEAAQTTDPIKQLPFENEEDLPTTNQIEGYNDILPNGSKGSEIESLPNSGVSAHEPPVEESLFEFEDGYRPSFELIYKLNGTQFTLVHFKVTDSLIALQKHTLEFDDIEPAFQRSVKSALWYIKFQGSILLRESRNSQYITFKYEDFK